jgi:hypothetical protein
MMVEHLHYNNKIIKNNNQLKENLLIIIAMQNLNNLLHRIQMNKNKSHQHHHLHNNNNKLIINNKIQQVDHNFIHHQYLIVNKILNLIKEEEKLKYQHINYMDLIHLDIQIDN